MANGHGAIPVVAESATNSVAPVLSSSDPNHQNSKPIVPKVGGTAEAF
jgi:hypothetical protein